MKPPLLGVTVLLTFGLLQGATMPFRFEQNLGQFAPAVKFVGRGQAYGISLDSTGQPLQAEHGSFRAEMLRANPHTRLEGVDEIAARTNYFGARKAIGAQNYGGVRYRQVYPGIDLLFYSS